MGIHARLMLLALFAIAPFLALAFVTMQRELETARHGALDDARAYARLVAARFDRHLGDMQSLLLALSASLVEDLGEIEANDAKLRAIQSELPD